jgi:hypothetical protein
MMVQKWPGFGMLVILLGLICVSAGPALGEEPSALEKDPQGWTDLLASAGPELDGWTRQSIPYGEPLQKRSPWSLEATDGRLVCRGDGGHEWLRLDQVLSDFILHVEWRFEPVPGKQGYNSGVFVRTSTDARTWHQAQCGDASGGYFFGETLQNYALTPFDRKQEIREQRVKPAGEWNTYEITCKGRTLTLWVNGAVVDIWKGCQVPRGYVGLEAEGWPIEFRNIKIKTF